MLRRIFAIASLVLLTVAGGPAGAEPPLWRSPTRAQQARQISSRAQEVIEALDRDAAVSEMIPSLRGARRGGDAEMLRLALELQSVVQSHRGNYLYALYRRLEVYQAEGAREWADYLARLGVAIGMNSGHFHSLAHLDPDAPVPGEPDPSVAEVSLDRWIDNFTRATYSPGRRPFRRGSMSEIVQLTYPDGTVLDIDIRLISDNWDPARSQSMARAYIGHADRLVPLRLSRNTTPRLWRAKYEVALAGMYQANFEFESFTAISLAGTLSNVPIGMIAPVVNPRPWVRGAARGRRAGRVAAVREPVRTVRRAAETPAQSRIVRRTSRAALAVRRPAESSAWPPKAPTGPKPGLREANAATWRYQRYAYRAYRNGRKQGEILPFASWRRRYYETTLRGGRPGRPGGKAHQDDVLRNNDLNKIGSKRIGNRYPDGVGQPGQTLTIRGRKIVPDGQNRVIVESDHTIRGGTVPDSAARAQLRDIRKAAPNDTLVVTDLANPDSAPLVYPPGTQPPARGPLPQQQATVVPYP